MASRAIDCMKKDPKHQQQRAAPRSPVPSRNSAKEAAIQLLSAVLGSVALAALAVLALDAVVLVTIVLVGVVVLGVVAAGLGTGPVAVPAPGCSTVGPVPPAGSPEPPGTSRPSVSPAGAANRADTSDPPAHPTPPTAPVASSHEASTENLHPAVADAPARVDQVHTVGMHARSGRGSDGEDAPAAAHGHAAGDHAGHGLVRDAGPVCPNIDGAAVHRERPR